jgi:hypothetical protein
MEGDRQASTSRSEDSAQSLHGYHRQPVDGIASRDTMTGLTQGTGERQAAGMIARAVPLGLGIDDDDDLGAEFFSVGRV